MSDLEQRLADVERRLSLAQYVVKRLAEAMAEVDPTELSIIRETALATGTDPATPAEERAKAWALMVAIDATQPPEAPDFVE